MVEADIVEGKIGTVGDYDVEFKSGKLIAKAKVGHSIELLPGVSVAVHGDVGVELGARAVLEALKKAIPGVLDDAALELAAKALGV